MGAKFGLGGHYAIENRSYMALADSLREPLNGKHELRHDIRGQIVFRLAMDSGH